MPIPAPSPCHLLQAGVEAAALEAAVEAAGVDSAAAVAVVAMAAASDKRGPQTVRRRAGGGGRALHPSLCARHIRGTARFAQHVITSCSNVAMNAEVVEAGTFMHPCEGEAVIKLTNTMVRPHWQRRLLLPLLAPVAVAGAAGWQAPPASMKLWCVFRAPPCCL